MRLTQFALALSTLVPVSSLAGQVPVDAAVRTLKPDQTVRIRIRGGKRIESRIRSLRAEPLALQLVGDTAGFDLAAIDSLWVRGSAARTGAIVGAAAVGVASVALWTAVCEGLSEGPGGCDEWGTVAGFSVAGAAVGGLIGAGVGALMPKWRLRYGRALPVASKLIGLRVANRSLSVAYTVGW